ncbi:PREDICTED: putative F-box protein At3g17620 [Camelina sativa]|uniref:F-box protein At3g17620 n=1 Tax=Camelina sativa TaxID=90675 RepID=A0ABM0Z3D5_CAMSA|nr:PREDICTED: putative F-box protein At3g17620 [Camelina sativa]
MEKMSDLPRELVEEILSRVPAKSMREVRLTCKTWNSISKHIGNAAILAREGEFLGIVVVNCRAFLISLNLHGIHNNTGPKIKRRAKRISVNDHDRDDVAIYEIYHCEGLLLCTTKDNTTKDNTRLVVWNPYTGQTRWICVEHRSLLLEYTHVIGYDKSKSCRAYKILRFFISPRRKGYYVTEMYELKSNSWRVLDVTTSHDIALMLSVVSLKGNTYWRAVPMDNSVPDFLICFDFTKERFGPHLPLPFKSYYDIVTLSSFGEEQLAVLFQPSNSYGMEIWVTTKIEPSAVSWSKFLAVDDMRPLYYCGTFLIDKEEIAVVVFHEDDDVIHSSNPQRAYIIGENGYFRDLDIGKITDNGSYLRSCSYVPSLVFF